MSRRVAVGDLERSNSTASERFWQLSGGVARCGVCGSALLPHTTGWAGGRKAPYYRCFQRYNSGPRDCTNTRTLPAAPLEEAVWRKVRLLLEEPERVMAAYDAYVELRGHRFRGNPDREACEISARLARLPAPCAPAGLRAQGGTRAAEEGAGGAGRSLLHHARHGPAPPPTAGPQDRRAVYDALRMTAHAGENGDVSITGIFDADLTELLPASWALAKAGAREYDSSLNRRLPTSHKGVVSAGRPRPGT